MNNTKTLLAIAALAVAGAASAQTHSTEDYFGTLPAAQSTLSRAEVQADLAQFNRTAAVRNHSSEDYFGALPAAQGQLSRAEVQADLNLWSRAGLAGSASGDRQQSADPAYAERLATYQRLRSGPEYLAEVSRLQTGSSVAGTAAPVTAN
ncbi:MAG: DUF4148 domain-containing protein [Acidovorax sp.]|nr:DUF4148 domain-containing protein [Acidovorax sp.]